jgi:uncharacterized protein (DUF934 family)
VGDVARDRLSYLERCGFDAFDIAEERFNSDDLQAFSEISVSYQEKTTKEAEPSLA